MVNVTMRNRAQLDLESAKVLLHLEAYVNGEAKEDPEIVSRYIDYLEADHGVVSGPGEILESPVLTSFVPLLLRILNSELYADIYAQLLMALLAQLLLADALKFFPSDAVVEALSSPANSVVYMVVHVLKLNLERSDPDVGPFLHETSALQVVTERILTTPDMPVHIVSDTEEAVKLYMKLDYFDLADWLLLFEDHVSGNLNDATLLARYLAFVEALADTKTSREKIGKLSDFNVADIVGHDDPFVPSILIAFYATMVAKVPFSVLEKPLKLCMKILVLRRQQQNIDFVVFPALNQLFAALSHASLEARQYVHQEIVDHHELIDFALTTHDDVRLFCSINIEVIPNKLQFFENHFSRWTLQLVSYALFCCLLHLVDNSDFFDLLVKSGKIDDENIAKLPQNLVYELVMKLSEYDYSASFLLASLPYTVLTHLMAIDPSIVNPDIWGHKQQALQNLLLYRKIDLGVWHQGLTSCYKEMLQGRQMKSVEPKVDVTDEAM